MHYNGNCFIKWSTQKNFRWLWTPSNWLNLQTEEGNSIYSNMMLNQNDINWVSIISALSSWCSSVTAHLPTAKSQILTVVSALALARTFLEFITISLCIRGANKWREASPLELKWNLTWLPCSMQDQAQNFYDFPSYTFSPVIGNSCSIDLSTANKDLTYSINECPLAYIQMCVIISWKKNILTILSRPSTFI